MSYKVALVLSVLASSALCGTARAQSQANVVQISTEPAGLAFRVDGQPFTGVGDFAWPTGSKHEVSAFYLDNSFSVGKRYAFKGWITNLSSASSTLQPITADPGLKWIKLQFEPSYRLIINLIDCPAAGQPCASAGRVQVNNAVYDRYTELWFSANSSVNAKVFPNDGYVFTGWAQIPGGARPTSFDITFLMVEPGQVAPSFQNTNSARVGVNIQTIPPNLRILADRVPYAPPIALEWGWGTVHTIGVDPVQIENGITYVFDSWSDGGDINHDVTVPNQTIPISFMARFVPAVFATFSTSPAGLRLNIDGGLNFPESGFAWKPGSTHRIIAPATQTDSRGQKYRFVSWSNGKPAAFDYVVGNTNERFTATYRLVG